MTAGGLAPDGATWIPSGQRYLLPVKALAKLLRGKFLDALAQLYQQGELVLKGNAAPLADRRALARFKDDLCRKDWNVYAKTPFKNPRAVRYLGMYTHRVGISNHRVVRIDDDQIVFRTRDRKVCRLAPEAFIRRYLQHVLPPRFVKIRHCGLYAADHCKRKARTSPNATCARARRAGAGAAVACRRRRSACYPRPCGIVGGTAPRFLAARDTSMLTACGATIGGTVSPPIRSRSGSTCSRSSHWPSPVRVRAPLDARAGSLLPLLHGLCRRVPPDPARPALPRCERGLVQRAV